MTCHDARELFSAEIDGGPGVGDAAGLQAHLAGCPECRRELARFRATVAVLRSVQPLRAPVGFVDRVLDAARPPSWAERLRRRLIAPLALRRPIAVTVTLLVAVTAVYLYEQTPEVHRGFEVAAPAQRVEPPFQAIPTPPAAPAPPPAAPPPPAVASKPAAPALRDAPAKERNTADPQATARLDQAKPPSAPEPAREAPATTGERKPAAESPADAYREAAPARPAEAEQQRRAAQPSADEGRRQEQVAGSAPAASPPPSAARAKASSEMAKSGTAVTGRLAGPADVEGGLAVADRAAARQALVELAARLGGTTVAPPAGARGDVVDLVVPAAGYPELVAGLARLGRWAPVREPAELPAQVRVSLRLTD